ncbi:Acetate operon repressor [Fusobacterium necrophorum subsp. necrophorum]|nr:Acetate operon repressor [Fusobacterium necrophorum subsp. necrophorum]
MESTEQENFPLHATSSGKIFILYREKLEELVLEKFTENTITNIEDLKKEIKEIEKNGYSTEFDEIGFGISSIAVPIFDNNNDIFGTISVTALTQVIKEKKSELILELKLKVKELEKELFYK